MKKQSNAQKLLRLNWMKIVEIFKHKTTGPRTLILCPAPAPSPHITQNPRACLAESFWPAMGPNQNTKRSLCVKLEIVSALLFLVLGSGYSVLGSWFWTLFRAWLSVRCLPEYAKMKYNFLWSEIEI